MALCSIIGGGYLTFDYPHGTGLFGQFDYLGHVGWSAIKGEVLSHRPFEYWNLDLNQYPKWKHATTGVGYSESAGHILFLYYNYPPETPFELNWDNTNHNKEAMRGHLREERTLIHRRSDPTNDSRSARSMK